MKRLSKSSFRFFRSSLGWSWNFIVDNFRYRPALARISRWTDNRMSVNFSSRCRSYRHWIYCRLYLEVFFASRCCLRWADFFDGPVGIIACDPFTNKFAAMVPMTPPRLRLMTVELCCIIPLLGAPGKEGTGISGWGQEGHGPRLFGKKALSIGTTPVFAFDTTFADMADKHAPLDAGVLLVDDDRSPPVPAEDRGSAPVGIEESPTSRTCVGGLTFGGRLYCSCWGIYDPGYKNGMAFKAATFDTWFS